MLTSARVEHGVSLIELMIGIAIIGILMSVGFPSFQTWIQNAQIRTAAESIQNGLQLARTEAVRRNVPMEVAFVTVAPTVANAGAAAVANSRNWMVRTTTTNTYIQGRSAEEGSLNAVITAPARLVFNPLGRLVTPAGPVIINVNSTAVSANRPLNLVVGVGGSIRLCDPALTAPNPQAC